MNMTWKSIPGETPLDISGLKISGITTRTALSVSVQRIQESSVL